jgi:uncharacterized membrane protein
LNADALNQVSTLAHGKFQVLVGLISAAVATIGANVETGVHVLDFIVFWIGGVYFTVQSLITILGAITALAISMTTLWRFWHPRQQVNT